MRYCKHFAMFYSPRTSFIQKVKSLLLNLHSTRKFRKPGGGGGHTAARQIRLLFSISRGIVIACDLIFHFYISLRSQFLHAAASHAHAARACAHNALRLHARRTKRLLSLSFTHSLSFSLSFSGTMYSPCSRIRACVYVKAARSS